MNTELYSPIILLMAALPRYSTALMRHGPHERTGGHSYPGENSSEVETQLSTLHFSADLVAALALSDSYIVAVTTKDYVRVYTLFGTPYKVYRQKSPAVTCAAWRDYVMTIGNGPIGSDGRAATLRYSIENVKRDEICQNEDAVALPENTELQTVFFSDTGVSRSRAEHRIP
jgi:hypothetical protein